MSLELSLEEQKRLEEAKEVCVGGRGVSWALLKEVCKIEVLYGTIQHYTKRVT